MKIVYLNGEKAGESWELSPPSVSIGREDDNLIQLLVGGVSRHHAKLEFRDGAWELEDLGSTNGTKLNGDNISGALAIRGGDIISIGDQKFRVDGGKAVSASSASVQEEQEEEETPKVVFNAHPTAPQVDVEEPAAPSVIFRPPEPAAASAPTPAPEPVTGSAPQVPAASAPQPIFANMFHQEADKTAEKAPSTPAAEMFNPEKLKVFGDIFGKGGGKNADGTEAPKKKNMFGGTNGKPISNLLFYVIVIGLAAICVSIFIILQGGAPGKNLPVPNAGEAKPKNNLLLVYKKESSTPDNVFSFRLIIENGGMEVRLDDLISRRHYQRSANKADEAALKTLLQAVKDTDFMKLVQEDLVPSADGKDEMRSILLGYDDKLNKIVVRNTYANSSFEMVERAVQDFLGTYNLSIVSMRVDEMREEAKNAFDKAEQLFDNYESSPENLREAITRYKLAMNFLEQFEPKPKEWTLSKKRLSEAEIIMDKRLKDAQFNVQLYIRRNQYAEASQECSKLLEMVDPESESYQKIRKIKMAVDDQLSGRRK